MIGEVGILRLCGWAALIMEWVLRIVVPVFVGLCALCVVWWVLVLACAVIGMIRRRRR